MNKRKAEKEKVDVGFWDSEGNYKQDIQLVAKIELQENIQPEEKEKINEELCKKTKMENIFSDDFDFCGICCAKDKCNGCCCYEQIKEVFNNEN